MIDETNRDGLETEAARLEREMRELAKRWADAGPAQTAWKAADLARGLYVAMLRGN